MKLLCLDNYHCSFSSEASAYSSVAQWCDGPKKVAKEVVTILQGASSIAQDKLYKATVYTNSCHFLCTSWALHDPSVSHKISIYQCGGCTDPRS